MFPQKLIETNNGHNSSPSEFTLSDHSYGKEKVKMLHLARNGATHTVHEFEVDLHLKLNTTNEYTNDKYTDVVCTDSYKNTIYILAKKHGVESPETFALLLAEHYLKTYRQAAEVHVHIEHYPWERITYEHQNSAEISAANNTTDPDQNKKHNHAFVSVPMVTRYCDILQKKNEDPTVLSGLKDLRVLKTTQAAFKNFFRDEYRLLADKEDRVLSATIDARWQFDGTDGINFNHTWNSVKDILLRSFSGDLIQGVYSTGLQGNLYRSLTDVLNNRSEILSVEGKMPNNLYIPFDTSDFQSLIPGDNKEVFIALEKPHGAVYGRLDRKNFSN